jgi:glucose/arabinose dehydrogenase
MLSLVGNFASPVYLTAAPGDTQRLFVVEQDGRVLVLHHDTVQSRPFLDIRGQIAAGGERGLLSLAFDPLYDTNGRFFVYFTNPAGDIRIVRYNVSATDADSADEATADTVLAVAHPGQANHNGGQLQFGPDGMLWAGTGDGGGDGDPDGNGQDKHVLLGKLLRLDVRGASGYIVPADNPFANDTSAAPEVWSYGLRNPWRFSFDRQTGDLYIGDVGQDRYEEVDVGPTAVQRGRGVNFGWNTMEGTHCYPNDPCTTVGQLPVVEYPHFGGTCSITGGYVYRGSALPALVGDYFYADFCDGSVHSITGTGGSNPGNWTSLLSPGLNISAFGEDARGELYILQLDGPVWRIIPTP